jgi:hypothetical protein
VITGMGPAGAWRNWVLGGLTYDESSCSPDVGDLCGTETPTIWSSTDGLNWTASRLDVGSGVPASDPGGATIQVSSVADIARSERGYVAVGAASGDLGARHETWVSADGAAWRRLPQPDRPTFDFGPGLVADGPAGVIGLSATRAGGETTAWELR